MDFQTLTIPKPHERAQEDGPAAQIGSSSLEFSLSLHGAETAA
jgi:hypothetical protein